MASNTARLTAELKKACRSWDNFIESKDEVLLSAESMSSLSSWIAFIKGPDGTPYEGGIFRLRISIPMDYPLVAPRIKFVTKIIHPNIHLKTGEICLNILKSNWTPAWSIESACRAIVVMLSNPEADSPLNCDAGNLLRSGDEKGFNSLAKMFTLDHAMDHAQCKAAFPTF